MCCQKGSPASCHIMEFVRQTAAEMLSNRQLSHTTIRNLHDDPTAIICKSTKNIEILATTTSSTNADARDLRSKDKLRRIFTTAIRSTVQCARTQEDPSRH